MNSSLGVKTSESYFQRNTTAGKTIARNTVKGEKVPNFFYSFSRLNPKDLSVEIQAANF